MQNIFPIAQKAIIEETIGIKRPSAMPPIDQNVKESVPRASIRNSDKPSVKRSYSKPSWFSCDSLSDKEKNMLKGMNHEEYLLIRNSLIESFESNGEYMPLQCVLNTPNYKLATLAFNFLEDNKIINYCVGLMDLISCLDEIPEDLCGDDNESFNGGLDLSYKSQGDDTLNKKFESTCSTTAGNYDNLEVKNLNTANSSVGDDSLNKENNPREEEKYYVCKETRRVREKYFSKEKLQHAKCSCGESALFFTSDLLFICEDCFINNKFPAKYSTRNFHRLSGELLDSMWTKEEEYILLKNIEAYGDAWNKVTEGLNKTFEQCIFHFIKMSIIEDVTHFPPIPFTQVPNPISTLIAFICSLVYPSISTEVAKVALQQVNNPNLMDILLRTAKEKGLEVLALEKAKIEKLEKVELEALVKRVMLKVDSINEMHAEIQAVKSELEDEREKLMEEFAKFK